MNKKREVNKIYGLTMPALRKCGQSFIEYAVLIILVAAAMAAMIPYITRAMNAALQGS